MSKEIRIKECPFIHIDESAEQNVTVIKTGDMFATFCGVCGSLGPASETPEGAVAEWNNRYAIILSEEAYNSLIEEEEDGEEEGN